MSKGYNIFIHKGIDMKKFLYIIFILVLLTPINNVHAYSDEDGHPVVYLTDSISNINVYLCGQYPETRMIEIDPQKDKPKSVKSSSKKVAQVEKVRKAIDGHYHIILRALSAGKTRISWKSYGDVYYCDVNIYEYVNPSQLLPLLGRPISIITN